MLKNLCQLKYVIENKEIFFLCENDTPTPYIKEACFQVLRYIGQIEDSAKEQQEKAKKEKEACDSEQKPCEGCECPTKES